MKTAPTLSLKDFFLSLIKPHKAYIFGMFFVGLYWAVNNTVCPYVLKIIINKVAEFSTHKDQLFFAVLPYTLLYITLWILIAADMRFLDWLKLKLFPTLRYDIATKMFSYVNQHSHRYFQNNFSGSLANKISDMMTGTITIFNTLDDSCAQCIGIIVALMSLLWVSPLFALILLVWIIAFFSITAFYFKPILKISHLFAEKKSTVMGHLVDSITNVSNVRLFARNQHENKIIQETVMDTVHQDRAMQWMIFKMRVFWDISIILLITANILLLTNLYSKGQVTIGDFSFIITLSISIFYNLWYLAGQFVTFSEELGRCKQALSVIAVSHEIIDQPNAPALIVQHGQIEFKKVTFHYDKGKHLFNNKNIQIAPGQKVGLVGLSGSGKSTFVNLILRLFDVESGEILIDHQNIQRVTQQSLHEQIGMIPQDIHLFHRSVMDNIRYGQVDATDEEVIEASKKAHCHEFIMQLPEEYHSLVGERGIKLSGGQRQRIAIARAILKNAPILLLDEATSALDSLTEELIQDSLSTLMQNRTTVVIAHRLSTLSQMDRILVFDQGCVIEDGTQDQLLKLKGHYSRMWMMQAGGFFPE